MFLTARAVIKVIGLGKNEKIWILCANFMHTFETATFFLFLWNRFGFLKEKKDSPAHMHEKRPGM